MHLWYTTQCFDMCMHYEVVIKVKLINIYITLYSSFLWVHSEPNIYFLAKFHVYNAMPWIIVIILYIKSPEHIPLFLCMSMYQLLMGGSGFFVSFLFYFLWFFFSVLFWKPKQQRARDLLSTGSLSNGHNSKVWTTLKPGASVCFPT